MQIRLLLATLVLAASFTAPAGAQVYKWKDAKGNTVISDTPQPGSGKPVAPSESVPTAENSPAAAEQPPSLADRDLDFKKRQQEKKEAAAKTAQEKQAADQKRENCERAKRHLATMESGQRVKMRDPNSGQDVIMNDAMRQRESEVARNAMKNSCN